MRAELRALDLVQRLLAQAGAVLHEASLELLGDAALHHLVGITAGHLVEQNQRRPVGVPVDGIKDWGMPSVGCAERGTEAREASKQTELAGNVVNVGGDNAGGENSDGGNGSFPIIEGKGS